MINPTEDPVACYLAIQGKIEDNPEDDYPLQEMSHDLAHILLACRTLIQHNAQLSDRICSAEQEKDEAIVKCFQKDIAIHELRQQIHESPNER